MSTTSLKILFKANVPTETKGKPTRKDIPNSFDSAGHLVTLTRLPEESNVDFRNRIFDAAVHPPGPTYQRCLNAIARDFGYMRDKAIQISLKLSGDTPIATSPRVDILANKIIMYSDWRPDGTAIIDTEIRTYKIDDAGYLLTDLVDLINSSTCFSASIYSGIRTNMFSSALLQQSSIFTINDDGIEPGKLTNLATGNIIRGSLSLSNSDVFSTETISAPTAVGEYQVDYVNGKIYTYLVSDGHSYCSYKSSIFPLEVDYLPVMIYSLQDDNFQYELFNIETLESSEEVKALPNAEGSEIYHQLFKETQFFWGE